MRFYIAMFFILGVALLLIPTANFRTEPTLLSGQATEAPAKPVESPLSAPPNSTASHAQTIPKAINAQKDPFRIKNQTTGATDILSQKDYVRGALCSEMPATFHLEALKAQAVAAHTYARNLQNQAKETGRAYDFTADPLDWKGYVTEAQAKERFGVYFEEYWKKICTAADSVLNQVMVYEETPIAAAYHAISAGETESAEQVWGNPVAYLKAVDSPGDLRATGYEESVTVSADAFKNAFTPLLGGETLAGEPVDWLKLESWSDSGYVTRLTVGGTTLSGLEFREALGLRSSHFTFTCTDGTFTILTKGYGHGVGLSQYGADYMARQGADYQEILLHYYQGAKLGTL